MTGKRVATVVFPAPAGINRALWYVLQRAIRVPRASGDKPVNNDYALEELSCSPRQRG